MLLPEIDGVVTFSFALSASERRAARIVGFVMLLAGILVQTGLYFGGVWDDWRRLSGLLPSGPIDKILLVIPPILLIPAIVWPVWLIAKAGSSPKRGPQAFYFDNVNQQVLISEASAAAPQTRRDLDGLSGYRYGDLETFGITTYTTTSSRGSGSSSQTVHTTHYAVGFSKTDGEFWFLDEFLSETEARDLVDRMRMAVPLGGSGETPRPSELAVAHWESAGTLVWAWKGQSSYGASLLALLFSVGMTQFGLLLSERDFAPGFWFCTVFAALVGILGMGGLIRSARRSFLAHAVKVTEQSLEVGTLPLRSTKRGSLPEEALNAFAPKTSWPLSRVKSISAVFSHESRNQKARYLVLKGGPTHEAQSLDIFGLTLSQTVDLEHALEQGIRDRFRSFREGPAP